MRDELVFDTWTPMSFKRALGNRRQPGIRYEEPGWVPEDHARRLAAYKVLQAYVDNSARHFLATEDDLARDAHREYGDAALIRDTILSALVGDDSEIVVPEAADYSPPDPDAENPEDPGPAAEAAWKFQEWLRKKWGTERGGLKMIEVERDSVGLGDGVYTLGWSPEKGRARIRVWDPGFYFPVLSDGNEDDFPEKVHIAWEVIPDVEQPGKVLVKRLTWELGPIRPVAVEEVGFFGRVTSPEQLAPGDRRNADGLIERTYPWSDEPSNQTCYYTEGVWELDKVGARKVDAFDPENALYYDARDLDLRIDFLPVVHIPNTVSIKNHYGRSALSTVLQILDDLANSDTDAQAASATAARPVMAMSGGTLGRRAPSYNPGEVWELGDGDLKLIDTSKSLDAVLKYITFLMERLSVNARTPDALLGRVKPSEVPSGIAMALSFGPLAALVGEMRLSRAEKYPILFRFLWRMHLAGSDPDVPAEFHESQMQFGSYLPQDKSAAVEIVTKLRQSTPPAASLETCVAILVAAGFPIEDATEEVARIEHRDFSGADDLRTALGSTDAALEYLGKTKSDYEDLANPPAPPEVIPGDPLTDPNASVPPAQPTLPGMP